MSSNRKKIRALTHKTPVQVCPACGARNDSTTAIASGPDAPKVDDISVCLYCGNLSVFGEDRRYRTMTVEEVNALPEESRNFLAAREKDRRNAVNDRAIRCAFRRARAGG